jgi:hypothetical protein
MYALAGGPPAAPVRKTTPATALSGEEDDLLPGGSWLRWLVPLAGVLLIVALGVALSQIIPDRGDSRRAASNGNKKDQSSRDGAVRKEDDNSDPKKDKQPIRPVKVKDKRKPRKDKDREEGTTQPEPPEKEKPPPEAPPPPSKERVAIARYIGASAGMPTALASRKPDGESFVRVKKEATVHSTDSLVSLPGYSSELRTRRGVGLLLRGSVRDFARHALQDFLLESAVVLHKNDKFDLDLTLQRGRIYLSNIKKEGAVKVRLRFEKEVWDLTLEPEAEVGVDLFKHFTRDINYRADEDPRAELYLCVLKGEVELRIDPYTTHSMEAPPRGALFLWDNFTRPRGPISIKEVPPIWSKDPPEGEIPRKMTAALRTLQVRLEATKTVDVALKEAVEKEDAPLPLRFLAIYSMAAIDDVNELIERLDDDNIRHGPDRDAAVFALRRWISRSAKQGRLLYKKDKEDNPAGLLIVDRKWQSDEAQTLFDLLHDFSDEDRARTETFEALAGLLESRRVAIAQLAFWHLRRLSVGSKMLPAFDAAMTPDDRKKAADVVRDLIKKGKLPPPPPKEPDKEKPPKKPKDE